MKKTSSKMVLVAALASLAVIPTAFGQVTLTASDALGTSSFDAAGNWSNAAAPTAGNDYVVDGFILRTPTTANTNFTFAGDSLTLTNGGRLLNKTQGTTGVITVNNLILSGGLIDSGLAGSEANNIAGNITVTGPGSQLDGNGTNMSMQANLSGTGDLEVLADPFTVTFSGTNTYTGNLTVTGLTSFAVANTWAFDIGASGVNNSILGGGTAAFDGAFNLDLSGAGTTLADSWVLVDTSTLTETFGATFSLTGFNDIGGDVWERNVGGIIYQFAEATGTLAVTAIPEPSSAAFLAAAAVSGILLRRRRVSASFRRS